VSRKTATGAGEVGGYENNSFWGGIKIYTPNNPDRINKWKELIPAKHLLRLVNEVIEDMGIERLLREVSGGRRGEPVPPGDDDQGIGVRVYDESMLKPDAGESGEGERDVPLAGRGGKSRTSGR
jgi:hypothetical protein